MRRFLILTNATLRRALRRSLPKVLRIFNDAGIEADVQEAGAGRSAGDKARLAAAAGVDAVLVFGGDGTVFDALQGLAGTEIPLGILPFGTGNILAQNLNVPRSPERAARWLLEAEARPVPLGKMTCCAPGGRQSWYFAMAAGMGLHSAMMETAGRYGKHRVGRAAYFAAGVEVLLTKPIEVFDLRVTTVSGEVVERRASEVIAVRVARLNLWKPGGGLDLPFLRLASLEADSRWRLARASVEALFLGAGRRGDSSRRQYLAHYEDVLRVECRPIPGKAYSMPIAVEADGEILGASCATIEMTDVCIRFLTHDGGSLH